MKLVGLALFTAGSVSLAIGPFALPALSQDAGSAAGRSGQTEATLAPGSPILAELNSGVDSKKAKVGDTIIAHTSETLKSADDRTIMPRGTKIEGHITQASVRGKGAEESALGIQFDKAILKDGGEISLNVIIQALGAPVSFSAPGDLGTPPTLGTTQTSPMSGAPGPRSTGPPSPQSPQATAAPDASGVPSRDFDAKSRGVIGLRGMTLNAEPANNRPASVVVSNGKSVHLDGGTRLLLVVQAPGSEPSGQ
jgi:hypothetical protein